MPDYGKSVGEGMGAYRLNYKELRRLDTSEYPMSDNKLDQEWLAHRLAFLWDLSEQKTKHYLETRMCEEKEEIYSLVDTKVLNMAQDIWQNGE